MFKNLFRSKQAKDAEAEARVGAALAAGKLGRSEGADQLMRRLEWTVLRRCDGSY